MIGINRFMWVYHWRILSMTSAMTAGRGRHDGANDCKEDFILKRAEILHCFLYSIPHTSTILSTRSEMREISFPLLHKCCHSCQIISKVPGTNRKRGKRFYAPSFWSLVANSPWNILLSNRRPSAKFNS